MEFDCKNNITVKFHFNEYDTVAQVYPNDRTVNFILNDIASKFKLPAKYISLRFNGNRSRLPGNAELRTICENDFGILDLELSLSEFAREVNASEDGKIALCTEVYYSQFQLPDFISVALPDDDIKGRMKHIIVEVINTPIDKPFLGGFIDRHNGELEIACGMEVISVRKNYRAGIPSRILADRANDGARKTIRCDNSGNADNRGQTNYLCNSISPNYHIHSLAHNIINGIHNCRAPSTSSKHRQMSQTPFAANRIEF